jgi:hypothetical protein
MHVNIVSGGGRQEGGDGLLLEQRRRSPLADAGNSLEESGSMDGDESVDLFELYACIVRTTCQQS